MGSKTQHRRLTKDDICRALVDLRQCIHREEERLNGQVIGHFYICSGFIAEAVKETDRIIERLEKEY